MASALNLQLNQLADEHCGSTIVSVGIEFAVVEVADLAALRQCSANTDHFKNLSLVAESSAKAAQSNDLADAFLVYVYCRTGSGTVNARMFDPLHGIAEDPATGSAAGALAGLLAEQDGIQGSMRYEITQGVEMGRPSQITVDVVRTDRARTDTVRDGVVRDPVQGVVRDPVRGQLPDEVPDTTQAGGQIQRVQISGSCVEVIVGRFSVPPA